MKRLFIASFLTLVLAHVTHAEVDQLYQNDGSVTSPPVIDAITFVNNGLFQFNVNPINSGASGVTIVNSIVSPFDFSDVQNYTNNNLMASDNGFIFDTAPSVSGSRHAAAVFVNSNPGQIRAGSVNNAFVTGSLFVTGSGAPVLKVSSTNVTSSGLLDVGVNGLISVAGKVVNLSHGTVHVEGFDELQNTTFGAGVPLLSSGGLDLGIFDAYHGLGFQTNVLSVQGNFTPPFNSTPSHTITDSTGATTQTSFSIPNALARANVNQTSPSNITYQIVFVADTLGQTTVDARFEQGNPFGVPVIQWQSVVTNSAKQLQTNSIYLQDILGIITNYTLVESGFSLSGRPQLVPTNYFVSRTFFGFTNLTTGNTPYSTTLFDGALDSNRVFKATNLYTALGLNLQPVTFIPDPTLLGSTVTNVAGRIEISADQSLDLTGTTLTGPNFLRLTATNHFAGSANARIEYPVGNINLGTTNGQLALTNLVAPYIPRFQGLIDIYSALWTNLTTTNVIAGGNTNSFTVTNTYHVLMVMSALSPTAPVSIQNLTLRSTNVVISDLVNISSNLLINAQNLTITANDTNTASTPFGELNLLSGNVLWSPSLPILQNFTNFGIVSSSNLVYFQKRLNPNSPGPSDAPYQSFVNHDSISTAGSIIWANSFENTGIGGSPATISSSVGPIKVQSTIALMTNGSFNAPFGAITIGSGSLTIGNHNLQASGPLTLLATNLLTDGVSSGSDLTNQPGNIWQAGDGFNLLVAPPSGDLLGTTVSNIALPGVVSDNTWAAQDRGATPAGFLNNAAVGHLVLDGGSASSVFHFAAAGAQNALYVDLLELKDGATNRAVVNGSSVFTALSVDPNMTVYFADAISGNQDISEKITNGLNGRLVWVPTYAGIFSSTNIVYPSGATNTFNRALVLSNDIDSDGDGIVNAQDPTPIFTGDSLNLTVAITNQPAKAALVSWQTLANSTNYIYFKTSSSGTNWLPLTNFVQGPVNGRVAITDPLRTNGPCYYKVRIDMAHP